MGATLTGLRDPGLPGLTAVQARATGTVLAHKPGRRATVLARDPSGARIAKLFAPVEFEAALAATRATSRHHSLAPGLLHVDADRCVLWLEVLDGAPLDAVDVERRDRAVAGLSHVLTRVHSAPTDGLPPWDAGQPARKLRQRFELAREVAPQLVSRVSWLVDVLDRTIPDGRHPPVCVHGDLTLRNVLHEDASGELRLVDWDRTAVGPAEVDLAPLAGLLGAGDFVRGYLDAGGQVDEPLLARLVLMNRLTRVLRRVHRGADGPEVASRRLGALLEKVADCEL